MFWVYIVGKAIDHHGGKGEAAGLMSSAVRRQSRTDSLLNI